MLKRQGNKNTCSKATNHLIEEVNTHREMLARIIWSLESPGMVVYNTVFQVLFLEILIQYFEAAGWEGGRG